MASRTKLLGKPVGISKQCVVQHPAILKLDGQEKLSTPQIHENTKG